MKVNGQVYLKVLLFFPGKSDILLILFTIKTLQAQLDEIKNELESVKNISYITGEIIKILNVEELQKEFFRQILQKTGLNIVLVMSTFN